MTKRVRTHTNPFTVRDRFDTLDYSQLQPNFSGKVDLEIGFGRGVFFRHWAKKHPDNLLLGVEVRKQIVDLLADKLIEDSISNAKAFRGEGKIFLEEAIQDNSLDNVFIFHPDPWLKKRHHKRRLVNKDFLHLLTKKMKKEAKLYISTDVESLWEAMLEGIEEEKSFVKASDQGFWNSDYLSHWDNFSIEDNRKRFFCTFIQKL